MSWGSVSFDHQWNINILQRLNVLIFPAQHFSPSVFVPVSRDLRVVNVCRQTRPFYDLLTSLVEQRVYCDKSPGGVIVMIPQSFPLLPTLLIHSDKTPLSLIRPLCSPAGLSGENDWEPRLSSSDVRTGLHRLMRIQVITSILCSQMGGRHAFVSNYPFSYWQSRQICAPCDPDMSSSFPLSDRFGRRCSFCYSVPQKSHLAYCC